MSWEWGFGDIHADMAGEGVEVFPVNLTASDTIMPTPQVTNSYDFRHPLRYHDAHISRGPCGYPAADRGGLLVEISQARVYK